MKKYIALLGVSVAVLSCGPAANQVTEVEADTFGILRGERLTQLHKYPAQRSVVMIQPLLSGMPVTACTAVLIGPNLGLTSAHCLEARFKHNGFRVVFGLNTFTTAEHHRKGHRYALHPRYMKDKTVETFSFTGDPKDAQETTMDRRYDLAVFSFHGSLPPGYRPAKFDTDRSADRSNEKVYGYGAGHYLHPYQIGKVEKGTLLFGRLMRGEMEIGPDYNRFEDLYFTKTTSATQACAGDSGGPQFLGSAKEPTVVGIHSARMTNDKIPAHKATMCGDTTLVTKVAPFADWVIQTSNEFMRDMRNSK